MTYRLWPLVPLLHCVFMTLPSIPHFCKQTHTMSLIKALNVSSKEKHQDNSKCHTEEITEHDYEHIVEILPWVE